MFERFTDRARRVIVLAQDEAQMLHHNYIGTEHILLGLIHEDHGIASTALKARGIDLAAAQEQVALIIGPGQDDLSGHIPFTPRAKKVLELSLREALGLGDEYISTEHILLGLIREGQGVASQVLVNMGTDGEQVRETVLDLVEKRGEEGGESESVGEPRMGPAGPRVVGTPLQLEGIRRQLTEINARLARIEGHLGLAGEAGPAEEAGPATAG